MQLRVLRAMPSDKKKKPSSEYLKYTGLAFQMLVVLLGGWCIGSLIDTRLGLTKPYIALAFSMLLLIGLFYKLYRDLMSNS